jgi:hypothetical protein
MSERPPAVLVARLASARREGVTFASAWPNALDDALAAAPTSTARIGWAVVLGGLVNTFRSAYLREPVASHAEGTLAMLIDESRVPLPEHPCDRCGEEIPTKRVRRHARWCSYTCRRAATDEAVLARREAQRDMCAAV